ncbi:hypothetical protein [Actomonas aquatica]|uniref:DUF4410 domain-containing protein n=1 Tax=Actomonas aquatica TaxID=2866162 RepID=A0ABZ1C2U7_9BACT|nr:hypothetical protein [Opitutus sp. WL0086]WRQ85637.1 hypothetical protein K1X11_012565 [Opitutus sp. WL0086]
MKNLSTRILGTLVAFALLAPLASAKSTAVPPALQVRIETPTVIDLMRETDIQDAISVHLSDAFRRSGFKGRIAQVDHRDDADPAIPLLTIRLDNWRARPTGMVECRFFATLTATDGSEIRLGSYYGTTMHWGHANRFTVRNAFEDAAVSALRDLYRDYAKLDTANADSTE